MSLSDYIKYLRAVNGGLTPWEIAEGSGVSAREIHLLEVKHRRMGQNDEVLEKLAAFFNVPPGELMSRREAFRKRLTSFLDEKQEDISPVALRLENGEVIEGTIEWYAREALAIKPSSNPDDPPYIVQRSWIADWRDASDPSWEVASSKE
jgi:transcriptional regulator with XRE-family HTH domain